MPFTLAHPAAVLPLARRAARRLSALGLVLGAIAPDLDITRHWAIAARPFDREATLTHTPAGVLLVCLPGGLVLAWLYSRYVRPVFPRALPRPQRGGEARANAAPEPIGRFVASFLIGAATHLAWDSATTAGGVIGALAPAWRRRSLVVLGVRLSPIRAISLASSAIGLAIVVAAARAWLSALARGAAEPLPPRGRAAYWGAAVLGALGGGVALFLFRREAGGRYDDLARFLDGAMTGGFFALVVAGAWIGRYRAAVPERPRLES
jgi:hypothetical protein